MSDDRAHCRRLDRRPITQPAGTVEPDAETRLLMSELMRAIDDPTVNTSDFDQVLGALVDRLAVLSRPERLEVAGQILAHTRDERYLGWRE